MLQEFLGFHGFDVGRQRHRRHRRVLVGAARHRLAAARWPSATSASRPWSSSPACSTGMPILYDNPKEVGADRIADAVAAFDLYGGPTIVVDFGTATTFEAISAKGEYLGGAIFPGIDISLDALVRPGRRAAPGRAGRAAQRDRPQHGRVDAVGRDLRLHVAGRRHVRADPRRARRRRHRRRHRRPVRAHRAAVDRHQPRRAVAHAPRPAPHLREEPEPHDAPRTGSRSPPPTAELPRRSTTGSSAGDETGIEVHRRRRRDAAPRPGQARLRHAARRQRRRGPALRAGRRHRRLRGLRRHQPRRLGRRHRRGREDQARRAVGEGRRRG